MYKVLARKYRPQNFEEVCGQKEVVEILKKAIQFKRIGHAYIFSGPRGVGKTTIARIFAKALNCIEGPIPTPCNKCDNCTEITNSSSLDVIEIDGASNRGIEEIRSLRDNVNLLPAKSRFKIYIIDEVHMLTNEAFNALLKTLEEPPSYIKFFFATTAPEKIPPTIISRCQRFNLKPLRREEVKRKILEICKMENVEIEDKAIDEIYEFCEGSLRDGISLLEQLIIFSDEKIKYTDVINLIGYPEGKSIENILKNIVDRNYVESIEIFYKLISEGKDPILILDGMLKKIKNLITFKFGVENVDISDDFLSYFKDLNIEKIFEGSNYIIEFKDRIRRDKEPLLMCEILILKLIQLWGKETIKEKESELVKQESEKKSEPVKEELETIFNTVGIKNEKNQIEEKKDYKEFNWNEILKEVKKLKPTLEAALREGKLEKIENENIYLIFEKKYNFHKSMIEKPANKITIEKIILDYTGKSYKIIPVLDENSKSIIENPEVKKIIEFFNGEIIQMEE
ncbi:MAG: DNA polymerase III subunit gamma/tau [Candidatus Omnitrophica bacterium]|nr:DNA polymerase III subunit gamma/tau [Candidatus Omnitrophota bacterium]